MKHISQGLIQEKIEFINDYKRSTNAASWSKYDANANVEQKNIATLSAELNKDINIAVNRQILVNKITELFWEEIANQYLEDLKNHTIYAHDETSLMPYCVSMSMYPFLTKGLRGLWWESDAPKNINSFCGSFINLVFAVAAQFAWAVATVEFLMYFDHFAKISFWENYLDHEKTRKQIHQYFQQVVYSLNQPAAARWYQSVFWNISIYDKFYFDSLFWTFVFPDGTRPSYESVSKLQTEFMSWFRQERRRAVLTFPVVTSAMLIENGSPKDKEFQEFNARELAAWNSFFIYQSESADSLASCCFKWNEIITISKNGKETQISLKDFVSSFSNDSEFEVKLQTGEYKIISYNTEEHSEETHVIWVLKKQNIIWKLIRITVWSKVLEVTYDHPFMVKNKNTWRIEEILAIDLYNNKELYLIPLQ